MNLSSRYTRWAKCQRGAALAESTLVVLLSVLLVVAGADMGKLVHRYLAIERIGYEGIRLASETPALEEGTQGLKHTGLRTKILQVAQKYGFEDSDLQISTKRGEGSEARKVEVSISFPYKSFFMHGRIITLKCQTEGRYLLNNQ